MRKLKDFTVGKKAYCVTEARGKNKGAVVETTVLKVGRKYVTTKNGPHERKYVEWGEDHLHEESSLGEYTRLFLTEQEANEHLAKTAIAMRLGCMTVNSFSKYSYLQLKRIEQILDNPCVEESRKELVTNAMERGSMLFKIKECMEDLMQNNNICNYVIVQNGYETCIKNIHALDAYMKAYEMSINGDVECYMAPLGIKAASPVFTVVNQKATLSGITI